MQMSDEHAEGVRYHSPNETFEEDGAEGPPVALFAITLEKEDFWCDLYPVEWGMVPMRFAALT